MRTHTIRQTDTTQKNTSILPNILVTTHFQNKSNTSLSSCTFYPNNTDKVIIPVEKFEEHITVADILSSATPSQYRR